MDELTRFCNTCNEEKDIIEIETNLQGENVKLSCGHRLISDVVTAFIKVTAQVKTEHKNTLGKLLEKYRTQIGGKSGKPAKWIMKFDHKQRIIIHTVEERNENGEWEVVHDHSEPFEEKKKK